MSYRNQRIEGENHLAAQLAKAHALLARLQGPSILEEAKALKAAGHVESLSAHFMVSLIDSALPDQSGETA
jgi:hypothetical protein